MTSPRVRAALLLHRIRTPPHRLQAPTAYDQAHKIRRVCAITFAAKLGAISPALRTLAVVHACAMKWGAGCAHSFGMPFGDLAAPTRSATLRADITISGSVWCSPFFEKTGGEETFLSLRREKQSI